MTARHICMRLRRMPLIQCDFRASCSSVCLLFLITSGTGMLGAAERHSAKTKYTSRARINGNLCVSLWIRCRKSGLKDICGAAFRWNWEVPYRNGIEKDGEKRFIILACALKSVLNSWRVVSGPAGVMSQLRQLRSWQLHMLYSAGLSLAPIIYKHLLPHACPGTAKQMYPTQLAPNPPAASQGHDSLLVCTAWRDGPRKSVPVCLAYRSRGQWAL